MNNVRLIGVTALMSVALSTSAATWIKKDGGTYDWNASVNWLNDILPSATADADFGSIGSAYRPTGAQTITGNGTAKSLDLHNNDYATARTFTGDITSSNLVLRIGVMNVEGVLTLNGTGGSYSLVGGAYNQGDIPGGVLDIKNGGAVRAEGVHALSIGRRASDGDASPAAGRVILREGGTLVLNPSGTTGTMAGLMFGRMDGNRNQAFAASYLQEGGHATVGRVMASYEKNASSALTIHGGSFDMPYISEDTRFRIGHKGYGMFQLLGGDVYALTNYTADLSTASKRFGSRRSFEIGTGYSEGNGFKGACFYGDSGSFTCGSDFAVSGATGADTGVRPSHATLAGTVCVTSRTVRIGANASDGRASLNLNGGTLKTDFVFANPGRPGTSELNADGGKIVFDGSALQQQFLFLDAVNIYEGGLEVNVGRSGGIYIGNAGTNVVLRTPTGYGVAIDSVSSLASSPCPPWIDISGGSGSNATAVAFVNYGSGRVTNAVIACRGEGYAVGDSMTATTIRLWGSTQTHTDRVKLKLVENKPGALVKTGAYKLDLFAQPEFAGTYECRQGWMIQTTTAGVAAPNVAAVVAGGGEGDSIATFQAGSGNATAIEANWNPVNPAATLTLGTAYGAGRLAIPAAATGETKPFAQTFASLTVNGTGNSIIWAGGNTDHSVGVKLTFGTISCAEGSQLTIPNPETDPTFKVYVTGMPTGTRFKNIVLVGTDKSVVIADDGQLVNATKGMTIIFK